MQTKIIQHCQVAEVSLVQSVLSPVSGFVIVRDIFTALGIVSNNNIVYSLQLVSVHCSVSEHSLEAQCLIKFQLYLSPIW